LESPTGSGKSLSLLCSVIGWLQYRKSLQDQEAIDDIMVEHHMSPKIQEIDDCPIESSMAEFQVMKYPTEYKQQSESLKDKSKYSKKIGKIYITSRTHKQISQLVKELRSTPYQPRMSVLGSRAHLCLHEGVSSAADPNEECRKLLDHSGCKYYPKADLLARTMRSSIWDIEDLVQAGHDHNACPYFAARTLSQEADVIFAPYNYVCDPGIRDAMSINLKNSVIVLDEAHNIEDTARECGSFCIDVEKLDLMSMELEGLRQNCGKISEGPYAGAAKELSTCYESLRSVKETIIFQFINIFSLLLQCLFGSSLPINCNSRDRATSNIIFLMNL
jgi:Rad3-related DNA helicase